MELPEGKDVLAMPPTHPRFMRAAINEANSSDPGKDNSPCKIEIAILMCQSLIILHLYQDGESCNVSNTLFSGLCCFGFGDIITLFPTHHNMLCPQIGFYRLEFISLTIHCVCIGEPPTDNEEIPSDNGKEGRSP